MIKFEPKNFKPIPKILFWERKKNREYLMLDMINNKVIGYLMVTPRQDELFLNSIVITKSQRRNGYGTKLLDFAKNLSKRMGFDGRLKSLASLTSEDTKNPPHIFYRKYGFTTDDKEILKDIDSAIKEDRQLNNSTPMTYMYYAKTKL